MTRTDSRPRPVMEPSVGCETDAVGEVSRTVGPCDRSSLLDLASPASIHRPLVVIHHLPAQSVHLHLTHRERVECEQAHEAQGQRMLLAGKVA